MQTDCIGGCEKKVNTEISQALLGTTNLFRKLRREESADKGRTKAKTLIIFARLLLPYCENGCAFYLSFSIGTAGRSTFTPSFKNGLTTATVTAFYGVKTGMLFWRLLYISVCNEIVSMHIVSV